jgi:hypothetical protein
MIAILPNNTWPASALAAWLQLCVVCSAAAQQLPARRALPALRLGGENAPEAYAFAQKPRLVVDAAGVIYALVPTEGRVFVFSPDGKPLRTIGRRGEGPGEFQYAARHGLLGDTLWIRNWTLPRISTFLTSGQHLTTTRTPFARFAGSFGAPTGVTGYLKDGKAFAYPTEMPTGSAGRVRHAVFVGDRLMQNSDTIVSMLVPRGMFVPGVGVWAFEPFPTSPLVAFSSSGAAVAIVEWVPEVPGIAQIRMLSPAGMQRWVRRMNFPVTPVPRALRDSLLAVGLAKATPQLERARSAGQTLAQSNRALIEAALTIPAHFPPVRNIVIGNDGTVWLERMIGMKRGVWHVLGDRGADLFTVELPPAFDLHEASRAAVWGVELDELDVPYIVRLQLMDR